MFSLKVGSGFKKVLPELNVGSVVTDHFSMTIPFTGWDFSVTSAVRTGPFVIETKSGASFKVYMPHSVDIYMHKCYRCFACIH